MKVLSFLGLSPRIAPTLPAGDYAYVHMFDQSTNGALANGKCSLPDASLGEQLRELSLSLELKAKGISGIDVRDLTVDTYLRPDIKETSEFEMAIRNRSSRKLAYTNGFAANFLFGEDGWSYIDTDHCLCWYIELNYDDRWVPW